MEFRDNFESDFYESTIYCVVEFCVNFYNLNVGAFHYVTAMSYEIFLPFGRLH